MNPFTKLGERIKLLFVLTVIVSSLRAAPGDLKWAFRSDGAVRSSPALGTNGLLYFGSADSKIYAVDAATGVKRWELATSAPVISSPAIGPDGTVFIGSTDGNLYACDGVTGRKRWSFGGDQVFSSLALGANGLLYFTTWNGVLRAVDSVSGTQRWSQYLNRDETYASPSIGANGTVFCGSGGRSGQTGSFFALDGTTGDVQWEFDPVNLIQSTPAIGADGTVFISGYDKIVYALDPRTGAKKWSHLTGDSISASPTLGPDGTLYAGSNDGRLYALDSANGSEKWNFLTGDTIHSSAAVASDNSVYFGSYDKKVYAVDGGTGREKWHFITGGLVLSSPLIGPDGTVYIGSQDGQLRALEGTSPSAQSSWPAFKGGAQRTGSAEHPGPPVIIQPPQDILVAQGGDTVLDAVFQGTRPMYFQWLFNGNPLLKATNNPKLGILATRFDNAGQYTLIASNAVGQIRASARLDVGFVLSIKAEGGGQVVAEPDQNVYLPGSVVRLTAKPDDGQNFLGWRGDASGLTNPYQITMANHQQVAAKFTQAPGQKVWDFPFQFNGTAGLAIGDDNTVFLSETATNLIALDGDTGLLKWRFNTTSMIRSAAAVSDDSTVVFALEPNFICAIDGHTGAQKWKVRETGSLNLTPAIGADGVIYICSESGGVAKLIALNRTNGATKWQYSAGAGVAFDGIAPAVGTNGLIYITTRCNWTVTAVDAATGLGRWKTVLVGGCGDGSALALGGAGSIYIQYQAGYLFVLNALTGAISLTSPSPPDGGGVTPIVGTGETVYLMNGSGDSVAIDGQSGQIKPGFQPSLNLNISAIPPALASDGTLYAAGPDKLLALDSGNGQLKWATAVPGMNMPLTIGPDGTVYVVSSINNESRLMAIKGTAPLADAPWPMAGNNARNTGALNATAPIRVNGIKVSPSDVRVTVLTKLGRLHHLEFKDSFQQSDWTRAATVTGDGSEMILHDSQSLAAQRLYRIRVE